MPNKILTDVCPIKLDKTYTNVYKIQHELGILDEYLLNTSKDKSEVDERRKSTQELLAASYLARDNLIVWSLKKNVIELQVMVSLMTAKIKIIEYKLGLCHGLDLHQACSLALVNFCNILAELANVKRNLSPGEKKTLHKVSAETKVPVWLSHYRNQICHVPSESPCISILVPLVLKSLDYMGESFWSRIIEQESDIFDATQFQKLLLLISSFRKKTLMKNVLKASLALRKLIMRYPVESIEKITEYLINFNCEDKSKNNSLVLEQVIFARRFELLLLKVLSFVEANHRDTNALSWLKLLIKLVSYRKNERIRDTLRKIELKQSEKIKNYTDISPIKCCHIVHRLIKIDSASMRRLVIMMRYKILPILGREKTLLLIKMTKVVD